MNFPYSSLIVEAESAKQQLARVFQTEAGGQISNLFQNGIKQSSGKNDRNEVANRPKEFFNFFVTRYPIQSLEEYQVFQGTLLDARRHGRPQFCLDSRAPQCRGSHSNGPAGALAFDRVCSVGCGSCGGRFSATKIRSLCHPAWIPK